MSPERDKSQGNHMLKRHVKDGANPSASRKRVKRVSMKQTQRPRDFRVTIGSAFDSWRDLKSARGLNSDKDVAEFLLDTMKKSQRDPGSPAATELKNIQVQKLIRQEIYRTVAKKERKLQALIKNFKQLNEVDFESSIQKLEVRINTISKRAEAALSHLRKTQTLSPLPDVNVDVRGNPNDTTEAVEKSSNKKITDHTARSGELLKVMENTESALKRIHKDKEALVAVMADKSLERPPPILSPAVCSEKRPAGAFPRRESFPPVLLPNSGSDWKEQKPIKQEPQDDQYTENNGSYEQLEPKAKRLKEEILSLQPDGSGPTHKEEWLYYPPLPSTPFPSALSIEAASYSIPKKLELKLAFIKNPTLLSVMWDVKEKDPSDPPMESYTILLTMEKEKGSGLFPKWYTYEKLEAKALPMCALIKKYKPGHKVCAAVVGRDIFGRYGPYSDVFKAIIPE